MGALSPEDFDPQTTRGYQHTICLCHVGGGRGEEAIYEGYQCAYILGRTQDGYRYPVRRRKRSRVMLQRWL